MKIDWKAAIAIALGLIILGLAVRNLMTSSANRDLQAQIDQRQQIIAQDAQLRQLNTQIIDALARLASQTNDEQIRRLLADHGVSFQANQATDE